jgi:aldose 1-epimerase
LLLTSGDSECTLLADIGGALGSWRVGEQDMLRRATSRAILAGDPLGLASFPLVPFSNRIGNGEFDWRGRHVALARNFLPEPHAIHGVGWTRAWTVSNVSTSAVTLTLAHAPDVFWPWAFEARQRIILEQERLTLSLSVRNLAGRAVPLAFGHHPYFDAVGAVMTFDADNVWMTGADGLPSNSTIPDGRFDFSAPRPIQGRTIDQCFGGVRGDTRIFWRGRKYGLVINSNPQLEAAVIYAPEGGDFFCFEPVPHINNALNLPGHAPAMPIVEAGAAFEVDLCFTAVANPIPV